MLRTIVVLLVLVPSTLVLGVLAAILGVLRPRWYMTVRLGKIWSRLAMTVTGIRPVYHGRENSDPHLPCVYMANHQSFADVWVMLNVLPVSTMFVSKKSLAAIPGMGWAMTAAGFAFIDRSDRDSAIRSLAEAAARVRRGRPVILFAEGTRSRDGRLAPFKKGPFHLALEAGVPVVPVAISGSGKTFPPDGLVFRPGRVRIGFAPSIDVGPYRPDEIDRLMTDVRSAILIHLDSTEIDPERDVLPETT